MGRFCFLVFYSTKHVRARRIQVIFFRVAKKDEKTIHPSGVVFSVLRLEKSALLTESSFPKTARVS